ncbi:MAG: DUF2892 domain-containing protein [Gemmatimonadetes bacterium]|uniref:DUF2892 domain-containing protein n=1 Tax=Candidatus Kutchimonas denitrificans TaxID=3056748 RepID=A0AAE4ZAM5_9BACT|nr:DUF2892 domain-containing protein [Gemmatimonadota bacterium]NIR76688.1 DUF2892 domain-containing protein [Candidatus Kutchimonas denitrificans]NIS01175.1 DUF2892 domain-containing protein [Gemmatimonadota bacterium]NIT68214.1 DUF2892 domain-containing protein [Gemmatimonadota bacterium]NIW75432.1 DUF2892 domain-containing protein [Gemmatimonadota bacterium]
MTKNMGLIDRVVRALIAVAIAVLYFTGQISGLLAIILGIVAVAFLVTSFIGTCPGYFPFNLSTRKRAASGGADMGGGSAGGGELGGGGGGGDVGV